MKKRYIFFYILLFPTILLSVPTLISFCFTHPLKPESASAAEEAPLSSSALKIKTLNTKTNVVSEIALEEYLVGVLAAEMPASYEMEALKAQAVAARSYIMYRLAEPKPEHPEADVCDNSDHCKGWLSEADYTEKWPPDMRDFYYKKIISAVESTKGEYMVYEDEVIEAFFFAGSGGRTEASRDVWGGDRPYLRSVESEGDVNSPNYKSEVTVSSGDFWEALTDFNPQTVPGGNVPVIGKITRTEGGSVGTISIGGQLFKGTEIRNLFGLKSANFTVSTSDNEVTFKVLGYGHGVGMSQFGANYMAKNGKKYTEILSHYYTNIQIIKN